MPLPVFYDPRMGTVFSEDEVRQRVADGLSYELRWKPAIGMIRVEVHSSYYQSTDQGVALNLYDHHRRHVWSIRWSTAPDLGDGRELELRGITATCYTKDHDPTRVAVEEWCTLMMGKKDGSYLFRYRNCRSWRGEDLSHVLPRHTLPFPPLGDVEAYLNYDYAGFEELIQQLPGSLFPKKSPRKIPTIRAWVDDR